MSILASHNKALKAARREAVTWIDSQISDLHEELEKYKRAAQERADSAEENEEETDIKHRDLGEVDGLERAQNGLLRVKKAILEKFG